MNIFSPYKLNSFVSGSLIEIELPNWRMKLNFFLFRIFPIFLCLLNILIIVLFYKELPLAFTYILGISMPILSAFLMLKGYGVKTIIKPSQIIIHKKIISGNVINNYAISSIKNISCKIRYGKYGGTFFYLTTQENKNKIEFITIPVLNMKKENTSLIIKEITAITTKEIEML